MILTIIVWTGMITAAIGVGLIIAELYIDWKHR